ncbi:Protein kinase [Pleurostoma richardsiae]|uniref:Protein kinase n=1 Tax=Pleurostoma richardsiae TaxID=41990 RepID=A0AA38VB25_9PEZI|nr:Protein kinase [Pleurostoma richardsiae]
MALEGLRLNGEFRMDRKVRSGDFGFDTWIGTSLITNEEVIIKCGKEDNDGLLAHEIKIYEELAGGIGVPSVHWFGLDNGHLFMVRDGPYFNLENYFNGVGRKFTLKTVLFLADQILSRIEYIHSKHIVHGEIKPGNFMMATDKLTVYITGFGLGRKFWDSKADKHKPFKTGRDFTGTLRFASIHRHEGVVPSRRNDIEEVFYTLIYFLCGSLPWQGIEATTKEERRERVFGMKKNIPTSELCAGLPEEVADGLDYARSLGFDERPDYDRLRTAFRKLFVEEGFQHDFSLDWRVQTYDTGLAADIKESLSHIQRAEDYCIKIHSHTEVVSDPKLWLGAFELHQTLMRRYIDFFRASQHPDASNDLRQLPSGLNMPERTWERGILGFLKLKDSQPLIWPFLRSYVMFAHAMLAELHETVPAYENEWSKYLGELDSYRGEFERGAGHDGVDALAIAALSIDDAA